MNNNSDNDDDDDETEEKEQQQPVVVSSLALDTPGDDDDDDKKEPQREAAATTTTTCLDESSSPRRKEESSPLPRTPTAASKTSTTTTTAAAATTITKTIPQPFHLYSSQRAAVRAEQRRTKEQQQQHAAAAASLRTPPPRRTVTIPQPFQLSTEQRAGPGHPHQQHCDAACAACTNTPTLVVVTMGQSDEVLKKALRRSQPIVHGSTSDSPPAQQQHQHQHSSTPPSLTRPQSPNFQAIRRSRPLPKSTSEREAELLQALRAKPFQARPLPRTTTMVATVTPSPPKPLTQPQPFRFALDARASQPAAAASPPQQHQHSAYHRHAKKHEHDYQSPEQRDWEECQKQFKALPKPRYLSFRSHRTKEDSTTESTTSPATRQRTKTQPGSSSKSAPSDVTTTTATATIRVKTRTRPNFDHQGQPPKHVPSRLVANPRSAEVPVSSSSSSSLSAAVLPPSTAATVGEDDDQVDEDEDDDDPSIFSYTSSVDLELATLNRHPAPPTPTDHSTATMTPPVVVPNFHHARPVPATMSGAPAPPLSSSSSPPAMRQRKPPLRRPAAPLPPTAETPLSPRKGTPGRVQTMVQAKEERREEQAFQHQVVVKPSATKPKTTTAKKHAGAPAPTAVVTPDNKSPLVSHRTTREEAIAAQPTTPLATISGPLVTPSPDVRASKLLSTPRPASTSLVMSSASSERQRGAENLPQDEEEWFRRPVSPHRVLRFVTDQHERNKFLQELERRKQAVVSKKSDAAPSLETNVDDAESGHENDTSKIVAARTDLNESHASGKNVNTTAPCEESPAHVDGEVSKKEKPSDQPAKIDLVDSSVMLRAPSPQVSGLSIQSLTNDEARRVSRPASTSDLVQPPPSTSPPKHEADDEMIDDDDEWFRRPVSPHRILRFGTPCPDRRHLLNQQLEHDQPSDSLVTDRCLHQETNREEESDALRSIDPVTASAEAISLLDEDHKLPPGGKIAPVGDISMTPSLSLEHALPPRGAQAEEPVDSVLVNSLYPESPAQSPPSEKARNNPRAMDAGLSDMPVLSEKHDAKGAINDEAWFHRPVSPHRVARFDSDRQKRFEELERQKKAIFSRALLVDTTSLSLPKTRNDVLSTKQTGTVQSSADDSPVAVEKEEPILSGKNNSPEQLGPHNITVSPLDQPVRSLNVPEPKHSLSIATLGAGDDEAEAPPSPKTPTSTSAVLDGQAYAAVSESCSEKYASDMVPGPAVNKNNQLEDAASHPDNSTSTVLESGTTMDPTDSGSTLCKPSEEVALLLAEIEASSPVEILDDMRAASSDLSTVALTEPCLFPLVQPVPIAYAADKSLPESAAPEFSSAVASVSLVDGKFSNQPSAATRKDELETNDPRASSITKKTSTDFASCSAPTPSFEPLAEPPSVLGKGSVEDPETPSDDISPCVVGSESVKPDVAVTAPDEQASFLGSSLCSQNVLPTAVNAISSAEQKESQSKDAMSYQLSSSATASGTKLGHVESSSEAELVAKNVLSGLDGSGFRVERHSSSFASAADAPESLEERGSPSYKSQPLAEIPKSSVKSSELNESSQDEADRSQGRSLDAQTLTKEGVFEKDNHYQEHPRAVFDQNINREQAIGVTPCASDPQHEGSDPFSTQDTQGVAASLGSSLPSTADSQPEEQGANVHAPAADQMMGGSFSAEDPVSTQNCSTLNIVDAAASSPGSDSQPMSNQKFSLLPVSSPATNTSRPPQAGQDDVSLSHKIVERAAQQLAAESSDNNYRSDELVRVKTPAGETESLSPYKASQFPTLATVASVVDATTELAKSSIKPASPSRGRTGPRALSSEHEAESLSSLKTQAGLNEPLPSTDGKMYVNRECEALPSNQQQAARVNIAAQKGPVAECKVPPFGSETVSEAKGTSSMDTESISGCRLPLVGTSHASGVSTVCVAAETQNPISGKGGCIPTKNNREKEDAIPAQKRFLSSLLAVSRSSTATGKDEKTPSEAKLIIDVTEKTREPSIESTSKLLADNAATLKAFFSQAEERKNVASIPIATESMPCDEETSKLVVENLDLFKSLIAGNTSSSGQASHVTLDQTSQTRVTKASASNLQTTLGSERKLPASSSFTRIPSSVRNSQSGKGTDGKDDSHISTTDSFETTGSLQEVSHQMSGTIQKAEAFDEKDLSPLPHSSYPLHPLCAAASDEDDPLLGHPFEMQHLLCNEETIEFFADSASLATESILSCEESPGIGKAKKICLPRRAQSTSFPAAKTDSKSSAKVMPPHSQSVAKPIHSVNKYPGPRALESRTPGSDLSAQQTVHDNIAIQADLQTPTLVTGASSKMPHVLEKEQLTSTLTVASPISSAEAASSFVKPALKNPISPTSQQFDYDPSSRQECATRKWEEKHLQMPLFGAAMDDPDSGDSSSLPPINSTRRSFVEEASKLSPLLESITMKHAALHEAPELLVMANFAQSQACDTGVQHAKSEVASEHTPSKTERKQTNETADYARSAHDASPSGARESRYRCCDPEEGRSKSQEPQLARLSQIEPEDSTRASLESHEIVMPRKRKPDPPGPVKSDLFIPNSRGGAQDPPSEEVIRSPEFHQPDENQSSQSPLDSSATFYEPITLVPFQVQPKDRAKVAVPAKSAAPGLHEDSKDMPAFPSFSAGRGKTKQIPTKRFVAAATGSRSRERAAATGTPYRGNQFLSQSGSSGSWLRIFLLLCIFRIGNVFLIQTYFDPDEFWQSLEPAYCEVFVNEKHCPGFTWEWKRRSPASASNLLEQSMLGPARSYLAVVPTFILYWTAKYFDIDSHWLISRGPMFLNAIMVAAPIDLAVWYCARWLRNGLPRLSALPSWCLFCSLISWFNGYSLVRTFSNSQETLLLMVAISLVSPELLGNVDKRHGILRACIAFFLGGLSVAIRFSSVAAFFPMGEVLALRYKSPSARIAYLFFPCAICGLAGILAAMLVDRYFYGFYTIPFLGNFHFNVVMDYASLYGSHPWHWYFTAGIPAISGLLLPFLTVDSIRFVFGAGTYGIRNLWIIAVTYVVTMSFNTHKEFRFLHPMLPIFCLLCGERVRTLFIGRHGNGSQLRLKAFYMVFVIANLVPLLYLGLVHQRGPIEVNRKIVKIAKQMYQTAPRGNKFTIHYLTGACHSTPLLSSLHSPPLTFDTWALDCSPDCRSDPHRLCEYEKFAKDPADFVHVAYFACAVSGDTRLPKETCSALGATSRRVPDFLVTFSTYADAIRPQLERAGLREIARYPHHINGAKLKHAVLGRTSFENNSYRRLSIVDNLVELSLEEMVLFSVHRL